MLRLFTEVVEAGRNWKPQGDFYGDVIEGGAIEAMLPKALLQALRIYNEVIPTPLEIEKIGFRGPSLSYVLFKKIPPSPNTPMQQSTQLCLWEMFITDHAILLDDRNMAILEIDSGELAGARDGVHRYMSFENLRSLYENKEEAEVATKKTVVAAMGRALRVMQYTSPDVTTKVPTRLGQIVSHFRKT